MHRDDGRQPVIVLTLGLLQVAKVTRRVEDFNPSETVWATSGTPTLG